MDELLQTVFFHPDRGAWDADPAGATMRLDNRLVSRVEGEAQLYQAEADGSWRPVLDEQQLQGRERGLVFQVWKSELRGKTAQVFRSVRVLDEQLCAELLQGLQPLDLEGRPLVGAAQTFLLLDHGKQSQARSFGERVLATAGVFLPAPVGGPELAEAVAQVRSHLAALEELRRADQGYLQQAREGITAGIAAHERATPQVQEASRTLGAAIEQATLLLNAQLTMDRSPQERANADDLRARVDQARERGLVAIKQRNEEAVELAVLASGGKRQLPPPPGAVAAFRETAARAAASGLTVQEQDGVLSIQVGDQLLRLALADGNVSVA